MRRPVIIFLWLASLTCPVYGQNESTSDSGTDQDAEEQSEPWQNIEVLLNKARSELEKLLGKDRAKLAADLQKAQAEMASELSSLQGQRDNLCGKLRNLLKSCPATFYVEGSDPLARNGCGGSGEGPVFSYTLKSPRHPTFQISTGNYVSQIIPVGSGSLEFQVEAVGDTRGSRFRDLTTFDLIAMTRPNEGDEDENAEPTRVAAPPPDGVELTIEVTYKTLGIVKQTIATLDFLRTDRNNSQGSLRVDPVKILQLGDGPECNP